MVNAVQIRSRLNGEYAQNGTRTTLHWKSWPILQAFLLPALKLSRQMELDPISVPKSWHILRKCITNGLPGVWVFQRIKISWSHTMCLKHCFFSKISSAQSNAGHYLFEYLFAWKPGGRSFSMCLRIWPVIGFSEISWLVINRINHK